MEKKEVRIDAVEIGVYIFVYDLRLGFPSLKATL